MMSGPAWTKTRRNYVNLVQLPAPALVLVQVSLPSRRCWISYGKLYVANQISLTFYPTFVPHIRISRTRSCRLFSYNFSSSKCRYTGNAVEEKLQVNIITRRVHAESGDGTRSKTTSTAGERSSIVRAYSVMREICIQIFLILNRPNEPGRCLLTLLCYLYCYFVAPPHTLEIVLFVHVFANYFAVSYRKFV